MLKLNGTIEEGNEYVIRHIQGTVLEGRANGTYNGEKCIFFRGSTKDYLKKLKEVIWYNSHEGTRVSVEKPHYFSF